MLEMFYPQRYEVSAYVIPYAHYHAQGIRGVIFDIDNTLVPHDAPADDQARELFRHLHEMGMDTCLLSNNKEAGDSRLWEGHGAHGHGPGEHAFCGGPAVYGCIWGQPGWYPEYFS